MRKKLKREYEDGNTDPIAEITRLSEQSLRELEDAIHSRKRLTQRFLKELDKEVVAAKRMLDTLGSPWQHGDRTEYELLRSSWDRAMTARKKDRRAELLRAWKDLLELRERRVERLRELVALGSSEG